MARRKHRPSKRRAIRTALGQLGWHASDEEVVALLASRGIEVSEGLVSKVKVETADSPSTPNPVLTLRGILQQCTCI